MVGSIVGPMDFVGNLLLFPAEKEFENPLRIDKVMVMSLVYYFGGHCVFLFTTGVYNTIQFKERD